ncbi:MAG: hypothetical protein J1E16_05665 [Muribaculaceae bacterium]|nr:hypothetical protein [Muribaculaceae bacterium]
MARITTLELARENLFSSESELESKFGGFDIDRIMKVRAMYMWRLSNPEMKDRQFIDEFRSRYPDAGKNVAHEYMVVVNTLLPALSEKAREFHRWRYNEMILETYQMAKARKDTKTMERAATSYGKLNRVDAEEIQQLPFHLIVVQPFMATSDPRVLGIEPIPNIDDKIKAMLDKYVKETIDIEDVEYEEADLEEDDLFAPYIENNED